jgi:Na+/H+ antiporter NhaD/arsenite permease-like protein
MLDLNVESFLSSVALQNIILFLIGFFIIWGINKLIQRKLLTKIKENTNRNKAQKFTTFLGYVLVIILLLIIYSEKFKGFTMAIGLAGAGIAFSLQEVIASLAGCYRQWYWTLKIHTIHN